MRRMPGTVRDFAVWLRASYPGLALTGGQSACVTQYFLNGRDVALKYKSDHIQTDSKPHIAAMSLVAQFLLQAPASSVSRMIDQTVSPRTDPIYR